MRDSLEVHIFRKVKIPNGGFQINSKVPALLEGEVDASMLNCG